VGISNAWMSEARTTVGAENLLEDASALEGYAHDEAALEELARVPAAVVRPGTEEEVAAIVALCGRHDVPLTVRGGGTGLAGACVPTRDGVILSLERLSRVIDADPANGTITVQAGVPLRRLYEVVGEMHLFFPPHPGDEGAQIGGVVAANAGGARAVKYGTVRRFVLGLQVVLADGSLVDLGGKLMKSSTGYHLLDLMIGSEGTLGVITRVTLSLVPRPASLMTLVVPFATLAQAIGAVPKILAAGIIPAAAEFIPHQTMQCSERLLKKKWPARSGTASLMIIVDGASEDEVLAQAERLAKIGEEMGALDVLVAENAAQQADILELRSQIYEALKPATLEILDICVPRSAIAGHVEHVVALGERLGVPLPTYGHAADGNVHTHTMRRRLVDGEIGEEIPGWRDLCAEARREIYADSMSRGGVISGEHGIGLAKRSWLEGNLGSRVVTAMASIKRALDPRGILNPGKIFPDGYAT